MERKVLSLAEREQRFHVFVGDISKVALELPEVFPDDPPGQGGQKEGQGLQVQKSVPAFPDDELVGEFADEGPEELVLFPGDRGQPGQVAYYPGLVTAFDFGQKLGPDAVAEETPVEIRRVHAIRDAFGREPGAEVRTGDPEERPDDRTGLAVDDGGDPGQAGKARPAHQAHEDGLGLVGHRMTRRDLRRSDLGCGPP